MKIVKLSLLFIVSAIVLSSGALASESIKDAIVGEVVDQGCYLRQEARGSDHQECAARCLRNGNPAGILTEDGKLYTLATAASGFESFAAKKVRVGGKRVDQAIFPDAMEVWENDEWVKVPLNKFGAPEK